MRLLHSRELRLEEFLGDEIPPYAILSHTWGEGEVSLENMRSGEAPHCKAYSKLTGTCAQALADGFMWVWIDTCCIDKSSSAELQEAINSMFEWYKKSEVCYAYLVDLPDGKTGWDDDAFENSRWWSRGWTLQELIAPRNLEFYAADWSPLGTKLQRLDRIAIFTGISADALESSEFIHDEVTAAYKLSWAARRKTTRPEDMAYCLLGLFNISMPLLYGEGAQKAFLRLQEEILRQTEDHTLFLWNREGQIKLESVGNLTLLSPSPSYFTHFDSYIVDDEVAYARKQRISPSRLLQHTRQKYRLQWDSGESIEVGSPASFTSAGCKISLWLLDLHRLADDTFLSDIGYLIGLGCSHIVLLNAHAGRAYMGFRNECLGLRLQDSRIRNCFQLQSEKPFIINSHTVKTLKECMIYTEILLLDKGIVSYRWAAGISRQRVQLEVEANPYKVLESHGCDIGDCGLYQPVVPQTCHFLLTRHPTHEDMDKVIITIEFESKGVSRPAVEWFVSCRVWAVPAMSWTLRAYIAQWSLANQSEIQSSSHYAQDGAVLLTTSGRRLHVGMKRLGQSLDKSLIKSGRPQLTPRFRLYIRELDWDGGKPQSGDHSISHPWSEKEFWKGLCSCNSTDFSRGDMAKQIITHEQPKALVQIPLPLRTQPAKAYYPA